MGMIMRISAAILATFVAIGCSAAPSVNAQTPVKVSDIILAGYVPLKDQFVGRAKDDEVQIKRLSKKFGKNWEKGLSFPQRTHQWPAVYVTARFKGDTIVAAFNDLASQYTISFDGKPGSLISKPGETLLRFSGLGAGDHTVRLEKISETQDGVGTFEGFFVPKAANVLPAPAPRPRQIEFIGDSYTSGYGNTSAKRECTQEEVWATTDTQQAFGPQTAKHYNADYQINSFSGIGIVRGYDGGKGAQMPVRYAFSLLDGPALYSDTDWNPQIVVIALGGNDFSTPVHANEKWTTQEELRADYIAGYVAFVKQVRATHPAASFVLMAYGEDEVISDTAEVMKRLNADGETRVATYSVGGGFELTGCDWHLNVKDDKRITDSLIGYFDARPELWQGK